MQIPAEMPNREKFPKNVVSGDLDQQLSATSPDQDDHVVEFEMKPADADHHPTPRSSFSLRF